ncbi:hypothetical protein [uncultured Endozoicomonas sp.]|uniref:hypothetical protein n=1 Tax=uncultured Endozoicomonas sp. TaxID=432652 RepID=UPI002635E6FE|nr:hypothetical protein [uncultured Endozoicomonas sp.]
MHRIDGTGATTDNRFTEGNPQAGVPATVVTADWLNSIQEELVAVIGAEKLEKGRTDQLLEAINDIMGSREVGKLSFRICDPANLPQLAPNELVPAGQILNRADYPRFWDYIANSGSVVTDSQWQQPGMEAFFSSGNGSTTFSPGNLVTGVFPRLIDLSGLYDPDRLSRTGGNNPGSWQANAIINITGSLINRGTGGFLGDNFTTIEQSGALWGKKTQGDYAPSGGSLTDVLDEIRLDASRTVPVGSDHRPHNVLFLPTYIYK